MFVQLNHRYVYELNLSQISEVKRSNSVSSLQPIKHTKTHLSSLTDLDNGYHSSNSYHGSNSYNSHGYHSNRHSLDNSMFSDHKRWKQLPRIEGVRDRAAKVKNIMGKSTYSWNKDYANGRLNKCHTNGKVNWGAELEVEA